MLLDSLDYFHVRSVRQYYCQIVFSFHLKDSIDEYRLKVDQKWFLLVLLMLLVEFHLIQIKIHHQSREIYIKSIYSSILNHYFISFWSWSILLLSFTFSFCFRLLLLLYFIIHLIVTVITFLFVVILIIIG